MGRCHEFGTQIRQGCQHPMRPGTSSCGCNQCGVVCGGQFDGCSDVWARGVVPVSVTLRAVPRAEELTVQPEEDAWESQSLFSPEVEPAGRGSAPAEVRSPVTPAFGATPSAPPRQPARPPTGVGGRPDDGPGPRSGPGPGGGAAAVPMTMGPAAARGEVASPRADPARAGDRGAPNARVQLFRWFESEFSVLRTELHELVGAVAQQQAMLAELVEDRHASLRLALLAESLPESVEEAVQASVGGSLEAVTDQITSAAKEMGAVGDEVRAVAADVGSLTGRTQEAIDDLRGSIERAEAWNKDRREDTELLDSALGELREGVLEVGEGVRSQQAALGRELPKLRAMRATIGKELRALARAVPPTVGSSVSEAVASHEATIEAHLTALVGEMQTALADQLDATATAQRAAVKALADELQTLKVSMARQLKPLTAAVERNMERGSGEPKAARAPRRRP